MEMIRQSPFEPSLRAKDGGSPEAGLAKGAGPAPVNVLLLSPPGAQRNF